MENLLVFGYKLRKYNFWEKKNLTKSPFENDFKRDSKHFLIMESVFLQKCGV